MLQRSQRRSMASTPLLWWFGHQQQDLRHSSYDDNAYYKSTKICCSPKRRIAFSGRIRVAVKRSLMITSRASAAMECCILSRLDLALFPAASATSMTGICCGDCLDYVILLVWHSGDSLSFSLHGWANSLLLNIEKSAIDDLLHLLASLRSKPSHLLAVFNNHLRELLSLLCLMQVKGTWHWNTKKLRKTLVETIVCFVVFVHFLCIFSRKLQSYDW